MEKKFKITKNIEISLDESYRWWLLAILFIVLLRICFPMLLTRDFLIGLLLFYIIVDGIKVKNLEKNTDNK